MTEFDMSEVNQLAADLGEIPGRAVAPLGAALKKSADSLTQAMRSDVSGHAHLPQFPASITADVKVSVGQLEAEVGPDKAASSSASFAGIVYFGTSKNGPIADINGPLDAEAPRFEKAIGDAMGKLFDE